MKKLTFLMFSVFNMTSAHAFMTDDEIRNIGSATYLFDKCSQHPHFTGRLEAIGSLAEKAITQNHVVFSGGIRKAAKVFAGYKYDVTAFCWEQAAEDLKRSKFELRPVE